MSTGTRHTLRRVSLELAAEALRVAFGLGWRIRVQLPLALGASSLPEPDVAVLPGTPRAAPPGHPTTADLVVEVADSSLHLDRGLKARGYARAGIADYWIVNLLDGVVEVYRDPAPERARRFSCREVRIARPGEVLAPLAKPAARILVENVLP